jgi:hypothetical protein
VGGDRHHLAYCLNAVLASRMKQLIPVYFSTSTYDKLVLTLSGERGSSFPLMGDLEAAAEMLFEYDAGFVKNTDELDHAYQVRIGYT